MSGDDKYSFAGIHCGPRWKCFFDGILSRTGARELIRLKGPGHNYCRFLSTCALHFVLFCARPQASNNRDNEFQNSLFVSVKLL